MGLKLTFGGTAVGSTGAGSLIGGICDGDGESCDSKGGLSHGSFLRGLAAFLGLSDPGSLVGGGGVGTGFIFSGLGGGGTDGFKVGSISIG